MTMTEMMEGAPQARGFQTPPDEEEATASPEEQEQYEAFVKNVLTLVYGDEKRLNTTLAALKASDDPVQDLASTVATLVKRVEDSAEGAKMGLAEGVTFHAGAEILEDLAELAEKAGIHTFTEEELETAGYRAIDMYRATKGDKVDQDKAGAELAELMNRDPKMAEVVGRIAGGAPKGSQGAEEAPSVNPETGAEEFWAEGSGDLAGSDPGVNSGMGDAAEGGGGFGDLLDRAMSMVGLNPSTKEGTVGLVGMMSPVPGAGFVANAIGRANDKQISEARSEGRFDDATGTGTATGFMGETVQIAAGPGGLTGNSAGGADEYAASAAADTSANYRVPAVADRSTSPANPVYRRPRGAGGFRNVRV